MSSDDKTGLDQNADYHNNESNFEEDQEIAILDGKPPEIIGRPEHIRPDSDDEYRELYKNATKAFQRKHLVKMKDIDSTPSERSKWVSDLMEDLQKKWSESFDNFGYLRTSICVSLHVKKFMDHDSSSIVGCFLRLPIEFGESSY